MGAHTIPLDQSIEQTLAEQPALVPVLLAYRLACTGCSMALFCTLQDAIATYNLPREQFLADLRHAASGPAASADDRAAPLPDR